MLPRVQYKEYRSIDANFDSLFFASIASWWPVQKSAGIAGAKNRSAMSRRYLLALAMAIFSLTSVALKVSAVPVMNEDDLEDQPIYFEESPPGELEDELDLSKLEGSATGGEDEPVSRTLLLLKLLKQKFQKLQALHRVTTVSPFVGCICVPFYLCSANGTIINDGAGVLDLR